MAPGALKGEVRTATHHACLADSSTGLDTTDADAEVYSLPAAHDPEKWWRRIVFRQLLRWYAVSLQALFRDVEDLNYYRSLEPTSTSDIERRIVSEVLLRSRSQRVFPATGPLCSELGCQGRKRQRSREEDEYAEEH